MEDRFLELKNIAQKKDVKIQVVIDNNVSGNDFIPEFYKLINDIKQKLNQMKDSNEKIKSGKELYAKTAVAAQQNQIRNSINQHISINNKLSQNIKQTLDQIQNEVNNCLKDNNLKDQPETRIKQGLSQAVQNKFKDILLEFQTAQSNFSNFMKTEIGRQVKQYDPNLTEQQVQAYQDDPTKVQELLQEKLFQGASTQLQNAVSDLQDKARDIKMLERGVQQVYQLFQDIALLVQQQGEQLDNIELNFNDAHNYVESAEKQLIQAKELHISAKKKQCYIIIALLIIVTIIIVPVVITM